MTLLERADAIARDRDAGQSELLARLLPLLDEAIAAAPSAALDIARVVCRAQPVMASLWHACAAAIAERVTPGTFAVTRLEMERAPGALTRAATDALADLLGEDSPPTVMTLSYSGSVRRVLEALSARGPLRVICGESRPRVEGRRLAAALQAAGADVTLVVDAALTAYLSSASAVVLGTDAVIARRWINKVGSMGLAAAAAQTATAVYVVAARDKFLPSLLEPRLVLPESAPDEVWPDAPAGIRVRNPYFESIPAELVTAFLTDRGRLGPAEPPPISPGRTAQLTTLLASL